MRKLEEQMNQAIRGQRNWAGSNTTVFTTDNGLESTVYLHGNHIATYFHYDRKLQLFDGGWQSVTTKSRLNALCSEFVTEILEWGVDHIAGVDFFDSFKSFRDFTFNPELDIQKLDAFISNQ